MTKTIKLYHGTNEVYDRVDLGKSKSFRKGAKHYATKRTYWFINV